MRGCAALAVEGWGGAAAWRGAAAAGGVPRRQAGVGHQAAGRQPPRAAEYSGRWGECAARRPGGWWLGPPPPTTPPPPQPPAPPRRGWPERGEG